jgi:hypothetical protein
MPKSHFWRQADAIGGHLTQTILCGLSTLASRDRSHLRAIGEEDAK